MRQLNRILLAPDNRSTTITIDAVDKSSWPALRKTLPQAARGWADANGFVGEASRHVMIPDASGTRIARVIAGTSTSDRFSLGRLSRLLPSGVYEFGAGVANPQLATLAWCLEAYHFGAYGKAAGETASLRCRSAEDYRQINRAAEASFFVRDLVNTPSSDMGPDELEAASRNLAKRFKANLRVIKGAALERGFPMIHAVGKASPRAPRLIDFTWGPVKAKKITLVGKGVCFDTGGLNIKTGSGMLTMKKDMGGAATVLGLARMIMSAKLNVRLRVLIPAVENSISGNAFRPGDVLRSRKGITVEIGNTDAEGRLVLGDALALADEEKPDLLIDMATLTGAARVALGPDLPPFYTDDDAVAEAIAQAGTIENDPIWRMPFWQPYNRLFESSVAGMSNAGDSGYAGSITAALFLKRFVEQARTYVHFDIFAWTPQARPGRPKGGEAQGMRALFTMIAERYAK